MDSQSVPPPKTPHLGTQWLSVGLESRTPFQGMKPLRWPADRNDNRFSTQRPAHLTIQSSRTKGVKKTKVGFDPDQCGFLRINDIILTVSGNLKRTKTRKMSELSSHSVSRLKVPSIQEPPVSPGKSGRRSVDSGSTLYSETQSVSSRLKVIPEKLSSPFRKEKLPKDSVSSTVGNFMRSESKEKNKKMSIDRQLQELDNIGTPRLPSPMLTPDRVSIASGTSMGSATTVSSLWRDIGSKGISLKPTPSLYETLVRDNPPPPEKTTDEERIKSPSAGSTKEEKPTNIFMKKLKRKKSEKKRVTIMEKDGSVYSPESETELKLRDLDKNDANSVPTRSEDGLRLSTSKPKERVAKKKKKIATGIESEEVEEEEEGTERLSSAPSLNRNTNCQRTELCFWESNVFRCASLSVVPPDGNRTGGDDSGVPHGWHQSEAPFQKEFPEDSQDPEVLALEAQLSRARHLMQELRVENDCLKQEQLARRTFPTVSGSNWDRQTYRTLSGSNWDRQTSSTVSGSISNQQTSPTLSGSSFDQQTSRTVSGSSSDRRESYQSHHHYFFSLAWLHFLAAFLVGVFLAKMIL